MWYKMSLGLVLIFLGNQLGCNVEARGSAQVITKKDLVDLAQEVAHIISKTVEHSVEILFRTTITPEQEEKILTFVQDEVWRLVKDQIEKMKRLLRGDQKSARDITHWIAIEATENGLKTFALNSPKISRVFLETFEKHVIEHIKILLMSKLSQ
uniref:Secreted protein n=1 Tax=Graphocephala atropunctata TaxID=36148 RepID=A0A1B6LJY6_9HEMI